MMKKGSVAIDGVSLTVNGVGATEFDIVLIPHTQSAVDLDRKSMGMAENLEADLVGKYVKRLNLDTKTERPSLMDLQLLKKAGFIS
jgi:riboflavin synthase